MKYGVIDVGGGLRGIYGAGVLDQMCIRDRSNDSQTARCLAA